MKPKNSFDFEFLQKTKSMRICHVNKQRFLAAKAKEHLTYKELCAKAEVAYKTPYNIANNKPIRGKIANKIAKALNVSVEYLLGDEDDDTGKATLVGQPTYGRKAGKAGYSRF